MKSEIIFENNKEERKRPKNLVQEDIKLFAHEFTVNLPHVLKVEIEDAQILRNIIFSLRTFQFYKTITHVFQTPKKYFLKRLRILLTAPQKKTRGIWITDEISAEYFHWFTDALSRLKAIESTYSDVIMLKSNFPVILPEYYREKHYISYSLKKMGYTPFFYDPKKRLQVKKLLSCTHAAPMGNYNSILIEEIHKSLSLKKTNTTLRKIYISRAKANKRKVLNENQVIDALKRYGYEIHAFEDYNFVQQLEIMAETKTLIGLHGAGLTNMMFMNKGGQVLELRNEGDSHNNCYFAMASSLSHDYYYLTNKGDREDTNSVNITIDLENLTTTLELIN